MDHVALCLWSVNERLAGRAGCDVPPLEAAWLADVLLVALDESEHLADLQEEREDEIQRSLTRSPED